MVLYYYYLVCILQKCRLMVRRVVVLLSLPHTSRLAAFIRLASCASFFRHMAVSGNKLPPPSLFYKFNLKIYLEAY